MKNSKYLARFCFFLTEEKTASFKLLYRTYLEPLLQANGLRLPGQLEEVALMQACCWLFEVESPAAVPLLARALEQDAAWRAALDRLGEELAINGPVRWQLDFRSGAAGAGRSVEIGPGFRQGVWHTYGVQDGLPSSTIWDVRQDGQGRLWMATHEGGVCRFDGAELRIYTVDDGLADNRVYSIAEDRQGDLWFGTATGVSRYHEAETGTAYFTNFTMVDGLADDYIMLICADSGGVLWFASQNSGVSRCAVASDGQTRFSVITVADGLVTSAMRSIVEDRRGRLWFGGEGGAKPLWDDRRR
jgi:ligand-binding sensor domain-containing protein